MSGDAIALVVEGGDAGSLSLAVDLPAPWSGRTLRWRLWLENGVQRRGLATARPASPGPEEGGAGDGRVPASLALGEPVPHGRHRLSLAPQAGAAGDALAIDLYVCPPTCFDAEEASGGERLWGPSVPVYALRSSRDWGLGDFGDLRRLIDLAADAGAHFVAVEPLHALFPHDPERADPGLPSSREWLNVLYLDVGSMRDFSECREARERVAGEEFRARLAALRGSRSIDYAGVAAAKFELFELLYRHFRLYHLDRSTQRAGLFRDFQREGGRALRLHAVFEALQERFHRLDPAVQGWTAWPAVFRDAQGAAVRAFAAENEARVEYYEYLQWQAEGQLQAVAQRACARGMRVGLCRALAAGAHPGGSEAWFRRALDAGTPPEGTDRAAAGDGQGGRPPSAPQQPRDGGFEPFLAALRANMRQAGALRLDQAAELARLLPAPRRAAPPLRELFLLLCLESRRRRCVVIGADPAEVPAEVAAAMARHGVLACRTRRAGDEDTAAWPRLTLAAVPGDVALAADAAAAACRAVARSPALLAVVPLASVAGRADAAAAPAGEAAEPSWRRKLAPGMSTDPRWHAAAALLAAERPCPALPVRGSGAFESERADVPRATYRLQFNRDFGFRAAQEILPYLAELGISHIYAAPFLKARPGSAHGYDIVDHGSVNPEIGSMDDFRRYCARLGELGLGQVLDVVPNHVGVLGADNEWWLDVLENGRASAHARHFDIDWSPPSAELRGKVLLPVLGDQYGAVLENGELVLGFSPERGEFSVHYHEHRFPIDPCDYPWILVGDEAAATGVPDGFFEEPATATLLAALRTLPARDGDGEAAHLERRRNQPIFKQQLAALYARLPAVREHVAARLGALNGTPGDPASFDGLDRLLERQAYRLASWRVAADDINYRRFFDVNDLAALRIEDDEVFAATHARIFGWIAEGCVSGLRVDHPDGLSDPAAYFRRLQDTYARLGTGVEGKTLYVVVEKIVGEFESLPGEWPVHGETGYRFSAFCNSLFVDAAQESRFSRVYRAFSGEMRDFSEVLLESRYLIMAHSLPGEVSGLASLLHAIAQQDRGTRDFTRSRLRGALLEIAAGFPVYRTYIGPRGVSAADRRHVERAVDDAARRGLAGDASALRFVRDVILSAPTEPAPPLRRLKLAFVRRFQQFTAPVMAKAMEDTAFYRYNRLLSLNEVGSDPRTFGSEPNDFHAACERLSCDHPFGLLGSSTHDSKRSEDVRARLDVLSEMPGAWRLALRRWGRLNARSKTRVGGVPAPSGNDEYLLYQTLLGIWPFAPADDAAIEALATRVEAYLLKAAREAKQLTSWMNPDEAYEAALSGFVREILAPGTRRDIFLGDFLPFQATIARFGAFNSLSQLLLKLTAPGVPDVYQGCERWSLNLVDPDNRRPVDFATARAQLHELRREFARGPDAEGLGRLARGLDDGRLKLYLLWRALQARRELPGPFRHGRYIPLDAGGPAARHVVAFVRGDARQAAIVVATRLLYTLTGGDPEQATASARWAGTVVGVPAPYVHAWRDAFSGRRVAAVMVAGHPHIDLAALFDALPLPLALLLPDAGEEAG